MERIVLVTGGNRGIGKEVCRQLAGLGNKVFLGSRNKKKGDKVAAELGEGITAVELSVSNDEDIKHAVDLIKREHGRLDVLINNAGVYIGSSGLLKPDIESIRDTFETNFYGPIKLNAAFIPLLRKSKEGRIINISSGMGAIDDLHGNYAAYRMSKVGLNAQTIILARELEGGGIKVNAMCPGWVRTDMGGSGASRSVEKGAETAVWLATESKIPTGKFFRDKKVIPW